MKLISFDDWTNLSDRSQYEIYTEVFQLKDKAEDELEERI
jgi:hypothetical protein